MAFADFPTLEEFQAFPEFQELDDTDKQLSLDNWKKEADIYGRQEFGDEWDPGVFLEEVTVESRRLGLPETAGIEPERPTSDTGQQFPSLRFQGPPPPPPDPQVPTQEGDGFSELLGRVAEAVSRRPTGPVPESIQAAGAGFGAAAMQVKKSRQANDQVRQEPITAAEVQVPSDRTLEALERVSQGKTPFRGDIPKDEEVVALTQVVKEGVIDAGRAHELNANLAQLLLKESTGSEVTPEDRQEAVRLFTEERGRLGDKARIRRASWLDRVGRQFLGLDRGFVDDAVRGASGSARALVEAFRGFGLLPLGDFMIQGMGELYGEMLSKGINPEIARPRAIAGGIIYGAIEGLFDQTGLVGVVNSKLAAQPIVRAIVSAIGIESIEEGLQHGDQEIFIALATRLNNEVYGGKKDVKELSAILSESAKETARAVPSIGLLGGVSATIQRGLSVSVSQAQGLAEARQRVRQLEDALSQPQEGADAQAELIADTQITPEPVVAPLPAPAAVEDAPEVATATESQVEPPEAQTETVFEFDIETPVDEITPEQGEQMRRDIAVAREAGDTERVEALQGIAEEIRAHQELRRAPTTEEVVAEEIEPAEEEARVEVLARAARAGMIPGDFTKPPADLTLDEIREEVEASEGIEAREGTLESFLDGVSARAQERLAKRFEGGLKAETPIGLVLRSTQDVADVSLIGAAKIAKGAVKFAKWSKQMIAEFGEGIKPRLKEIWKNARQIVKLEKDGSPVSTRLSDGRLAPEDLFTDKAILPPEGKQIRRFAERAAAAPELTEHSKPILEAEENYYKAQNRQEAERTVARMSDSDLEDVVRQGPSFGTDPDTNLYTLAAGELIGRKEDPTALIQQLARAGTNMGQLISQFNGLLTSTPKGTVAIFESGMKKQGLELAPAGRKRLTELAAADKAASGKADAALRAFLEDVSEENMDALSKAADAAHKTKDAMLKEMTALAPPSIATQIKQLIQGGLLTPMSHLRNLTGNTIFQALRAAYQTMGTPIDMLDSVLTGQKRALTLPSIKGVAKGGLAGLKTAIRQARSGISDQPIKGEAGIRGFLPLEALKRVFASAESGKLPVTAEGRVPARVRIAKVIEASPMAVLAEAHFRALNFEDVPFREAVRVSVLSELADLRGIRGDDKKRFMISPPTDAVEVANREALEGVFQNNDGILIAMLNAYNHKVQSSNALRWLDAVGTTAFAPFKMTPINLADQLAQLAFPAYPAARYLAEQSARSKARTQSQKLAHKRAAGLYAGKVALGSTLWVASAWLVANGLVSGDRDPDRKKRALQFGTIPPRNINISGLKRVLDAKRKGTFKGDEGNWQAGDTVQDLDAFGLIGGMAVMVANVDRQGENGKGWSTKWYLAGGPSALNVMTEQTVLKGARTILDSIAKGNYDRVWEDYVSTMMAVGVPNTFGALNRVRQESIPDLRPKNGRQAFLNAFAEKWPLTEFENFPSKRDFLGRKIKRTPEGSSPIPFNLFDPAKTRVIPRDKFVRFLLDEFERTGDADVIPLEPRNTFKHEGELIEMNETDYEAFAERVGVLRRQALVRFMEGKQRGQVVRPADLAKAYADARSLAKREMLIKLGKPIKTPRRRSRRGGSRRR